jgi:hypothetical protein
MFYVRINKIKVFNNREGFLGLFNKAELQIYGYVTGYPAAMGDTAPAGQAPDTGILTLSDLAGLPDDKARRDRLAAAVAAEAGKLRQSAHLEIKGVKDNQWLLFGESGLLLYQSDAIPERLDIQLWVIESDEDVRHAAATADTVLDSEAFKGLFAAVETALAVTNPLLTGAIAVGGVAVSLLRQGLRANKDDLVGYWQESLNRSEHFPHGCRDRQDVYDTTGNILVDYTLFGFEAP